MKYYIAAPGMPNSEENFPEVEPTSCLTEGILRWICLPMMETHSRRCVITLSPVDFMNLHHCLGFAEICIQTSLQDGKRSTAVVRCEDERAMILGLSPYSKNFDLCAPQS